MNLPTATQQHQKEGHSSMKSVGRMVGVTGIEPVTPTMSTSLPSRTGLIFREETASQQAVSGHMFLQRSGSQVQRTSGHYVAPRPLPLARLAGEVGA